jgi:hypothetical protein
MKIEITYDDETGRLRVKMNKVLNDRGTLMGYAIGPYTVESRNGDRAYRKWWHAAGPGIRRGEHDTLEDALEDVASHLVHCLDVIGKPWATTEDEVRVLNEASDHRKAYELNRYMLSDEAREHGDR